MAMRIAICDDEHVINEMLKIIIEKTFSKLAHDCDIELYKSGDMLLQYLSSHPCYFHIYLLDIEMEGINGLETAHRIREQDAEAIIIFVTSHRELMPEAFRVLAFEFIIKPFHQEAVNRIILSAIRLLESRRTLFTYVIRKKTHSLFLSKIENLESKGRKVILQTTQGERIEYYGTLKNAAAKLSSLTFAQPHKSYIINLEHTRRLESWSILMQSGNTIPVSALFHDSFHIAYRRFILSRSIGGS